MQYTPVYRSIRIARLARYKQLKADKPPGTRDLGLDGTSSGLVQPRKVFLGTCSKTLLKRQTNNHNCDVVLQSTGRQTHASCKRIGCFHDGALCRQGADSFGSYVLGQSVGRQKQPTTSKLRLELDRQRLARSD